MNEDNWKKELWDKFKSPLGHSSIDNKTNSMYDLESFITKILKPKDPHKDCISKEEVEKLETYQVSTIPELLGKELIDKNKLT